VLPRVAWDNAALSLLERTLDDSANRRLILPGAFLAVDEMLRCSHGVIRELQINRDMVARNLAMYNAFASVERVLMAVVKAGADRQQMHERLRAHSMQAWARVIADGSNPLCEMLSADGEITQYIPEQQVRDLMDAGSYVGDAPERARRLAADIRRTLSDSTG